MRGTVRQGSLPAQFQRALGSRTGLVDAIHFHSPDRDAPNAFQTSMSRCDLESLLGYDGEIDLGASGKGTSVADSLASCVGETLERYALCWPDDDRLHRASYDELRAGDDEVVDFEYLDEFSPALREAHLGAFTRATEVNWVAGTDLCSGDRVHVPAQHVWNPVGPLAGEPRRVLASSSGVAAGPSLEAALLRALLEAIERDGITRTWWRQVPPGRVAAEALPWLAPTIESLVPHDDLSVHLFECPSRVDVPVYGSALVHDQQEYPAFTMAGGAAFDVRAATRDAAIEALQGWPYLQDLAVRYDPGEFELADVVDDFARNVVYYAQPEHVDEVAFLFDGPEIQPEAADALSDSGSSEEATVDRRLRRVLSLLDDADCTPIAFDLTTADVRQCGAHVARVFVPEFVRLYPPAVVPEGHPAFDGESITDKPHPYP